MKNKNLSNLYWFCQVVKHGGFTPAARRLAVSTPTLSRAVANLERQVGEKLLHRNAKQFQLTVAGETYYATLNEHFEKLDEQVLHLNNRQLELSGDLRLMVPHDLVKAFVHDWTLEFLELYPKLRVHLVTGVDDSQFISHQLDLAIVVEPAHNKDLIQRRVFGAELWLAASPKYLAENSTPTSLQDLQDHHLLSSIGRTVWRFGEQSLRVRPSYSVDSMNLLIDAACRHRGICLALSKMLEKALEEKQLVRVLEDLPVPRNSIYMLYSDRELIPAKVVALRNFLVEKFKTF